MARKSNNGTKFENAICKAALLYGFDEMTRDDYEHFEKYDALPQRCIVREYKYTNLYGMRDARKDMALFVNGELVAAIEAKFQDVEGSIGKKIHYAYHDARHSTLDCDQFVLVGGKILKKTHKQNGTPNTNHFDYNGPKAMANDEVTSCVLRNGVWKPVSPVRKTYVCEMGAFENWLQNNHPVSDMQRV